MIWIAFKRFLGVVLGMGWMFMVWLYSDCVVGSGVFEGKEDYSGV